MAASATESLARFAKSSLKASFLLVFSEVTFQSTSLVTDVTFNKVLSRMFVLVKKEAAAARQHLVTTLKGDPILRAFLHITLGKVFLMTSLDVFTLLVSQNISY